MDRLLRDLCQGCPWFNERPRKYEPRCGARFTDLDHALPPPDHPGEPVHRQRQPGRGDLPKPKGSSRFPATYTGGAPTLADWQDAGMVLACADCGWREVFSVTDLRARMPPETMLVNLRVTLAADYSRWQGVHSTMQCGAIRTVDTLWAAIGRLVDAFTPTECANYFAAAGYNAI